MAPFLDAAASGGPGPLRAGAHVQPRRRRAAGPAARDGRPLARGGRPPGRRVGRPQRRRVGPLGAGRRGGRHRAPERMAALRALMPRPGPPDPRRRAPRAGGPRTSGRRSAGTRAGALVRPAARSSSPRARGAAAAARTLCAREDPPGWTPRASCDKGEITCRVPARAQRDLLRGTAEAVIKRAAATITITRGPEAITPEIEAAIEWLVLPAGRVAAPSLTDGPRGIPATAPVAARSSPPSPSCWRGAPPGPTRRRSMRPPTSWSTRRPARRWRAARARSGAPDGQHHQDHDRPGRAGAGRTWTDRLTVPPAAAAIEGSSGRLEDGGALSVRDLLTALLVPSGNDAAVDPRRGGRRAPRPASWR